MAVRMRIKPLLALLAALLLWSTPLGLSTAAAADRGATVATDELQMIRLTADTASPGDSSGKIRFQAALDYQLRSIPDGFLLMFLFENDAESATENSDSALKVPWGSGKVTLDTVYEPRPGVDTVTLFVGLFKNDQTMLAWASTNPISLASWPGRAAFANAMAARSEGNYAASMNQLSAAISAAPNNGRFYYWRADARMHLTQYDEAIADFSRALELMPGDRATLVGRGVARLWTQAWEPAIADVTPVINGKTEPDKYTAWALRARGIAEAALGQPEAAVTDYRVYLASAPDTSDRAQIEGWIQELGTGQTVTGGPQESTPS